MAEENAKSEEKRTGESGEGKEKRRKLLGIEPIETHHEIALRGTSLKYTARTGVIPLTDEFGETRAEVFFTAYELDGVEDRSDRPLTFAFNGGPGSSSVWLHMGALGPKRVVMEDEGWMPSPPYRHADNESTWLDRTDLVFVDPVGTGFSRAAKQELDKAFWSFKGDIESIGEFIRRYLTQYRRWSSPLFLAGESYGTTRAAGLAEYLVDRGIAFNGIVLISTALDFGAIRFMPGNDLPYQLFVPTYAAAAWYHGKLSRELQARSLADLMAQVKAWSEGELTLALMKGDRLDGAERRSVAETLSAYTGLDLDYVLGTNLRVHIQHFCKELLRAERRSVGRLDARFKGVEAVTVTERPEFDPSMLAITPPYTAAFNDYVRSELRVETDLTYETLSMQVNEKWEWEKGTMPATGEALRSAMAKNPYTKVLVGQGYYDLATPHFAAEYMISHMNIDPEHRGNIVMASYEAGHMFYLDVGSLTAFKDDVDRFIRSAA